MTRRAHAILVFGCPPRADGSVTPALRRRLERALAEAHEDPGALVVVTGGARAGAAEGAVMRDWLVEHGVALERIAVEARARWTIENAVFVVPTLREQDVQRVTLVTARYHMRRARVLLHLALRRAGLGHLQTCPAPAADGDKDEDRKTKATEIAKIGWSLVIAPLWLLRKPRREG